MKNDNYTYAIGRRKSASARVRLVPGNGAIIINDVPAEQYFSSSKKLINHLQKAFTILELNNKYNVIVKASGSGHSAQADAIRLGIAKALTIKNENLKSTLKRANQLGRDPREKERKKFGLKGARKKRQFTKR